jgi:hypothetical protein
MSSNEARHEFAFWRGERAAISRGLRQLKRLRNRALRDEEFAYRELLGMLLLGEVTIVPDSRGLVPADGVLVAEYYTRLIADSERRLPIARRNAWIARAGLRPLPLLAGPRRRERRRESRPRRRRRRIRSGSRGDPPEPDDPEPPSRARARLLVVPAGGRRP